MINNPFNIIPITKAREKLGNLTEETTKDNFIDPRLLKYTREFTQKEIDEWEKEDAL